VPGLGTSLGRGGATSFPQDLPNSDVIVIQGSNMAECHPVAFQWVVEAKERGATVIHIDPRFTRTSALADIYVSLRPGSDIVFLGAIVNHILSNGLDFREYVVHYTNAATIISEDFADTEDLDGLFSGWDPDTRTYDPTSWQYDGHDVHAAAGSRQSAAGTEKSGGGGGTTGEGKPPRTDPTLQDPHCVYQLLRKHFRRYTPEMVAEVCGVAPDDFQRVCDVLCAASGRERTAAFCYAVGWTQHTVGVQYIRTATIIQLLLGNIGRPGGGILALRGHASIQGSTDIPTLYDLLPGYLPMPQAGTDSLADYVEGNRSEGGFWADLGAYTVSLLKSWWGDAATVHNDYCFDRIPRLTGDHSVFQHILGMFDGTVRGYFLLGENPAVGSPASKVHRQALAKLDWLVVRDLVEIESATFWRDAPEVSSGEIDPALCGTEVFLLPAASHVEKDGTFTNTQRLLQWHHQAVEPPGDARSDLWFAYHMGLRIRARLAGSGLERDRGVLDLTWDYPTHGPFDEPSAAAVLQEVNGNGPDGAPLSTFTELRDDGSTRCGCWIYCGCYADGVNQTTRRRPGSEQSWVAPEWGWAWPANRRMLYNRASADPDGRPWSERKAYVWWDADQGRWTGHDVPDFPLTKSPDYTPPPDATGPDALSGHDPFIMQDDGKGWLYVPVGLRDGPLPTHYEPQESPLRNPLYGQQSNPAMQRVGESVVPFNPDGDEFPYVVTSYRLTEHHTAGGMTRTVAHLNDLQPEMFCEVGPLLALERGLEHGGWATIRTSRAEIEARVMVTERVGPITIDGRQIHQVGLPYHWGYSGPATGDSANDLFHLALDPNVHIEEVKAATCDVRPGRRRRGRRP